MTNLLTEKNFVDFSNCKNTTSVLLEISNIAEKEEYKGQGIQLQLGDIDLTESHIFSIKSILENFGIDLMLVHTDSPKTQLASLKAGLAVASKNHESKEKDGMQSANSDIKGSSVQTFYLKQTLRSGQTIEFDGNIVVIGDCNPGSEIIASGDVTIWGILSGIAHAGAKGNRSASIRALKINAIQLRLADLYARRPDKVHMEKIEKPDAYVPEEAKIVDGEIIIHSLNG
ncbi:MAG: septum site-determining protein MinC [Candidatus Gastranaerophilales bacterium]|nr:septum site-determining protein MinC [Candidatus Gastranaerophilales bacterium]